MRRVTRVSPISNVFRASSSSRLHLSQSLRLYCAHRCRYASTIRSSLPTRARVASDAVARYNEIGVQQLSSHIHPQLFPGSYRKPSDKLIELSKDHLTRHELLGKNQDQGPPIALDLPPLHGKTLDEHFYRLGKAASKPYLGYAHEYSSINLPQQPREWVHRSGWTKYNSDGSTEAVDAPKEEMLTFDTEVLYKVSPFAVMACAASPTAWYAWLSPWLMGESDDSRHLIPLGDPSQARIIIGHNIGYDRARIAEEYDLKQSKNFPIDTMSLHVAVNGMCSRQRPTWMKQMKNRDIRDKLTASASNSTELATLLENDMLSEEEEELWVSRSSINSLRDVAKFHCGITIDKAQREYFGELEIALIREKLDELLTYCAADVSITHRVYKKVFQGYVEVCPHPVSFGALRHLSSSILPVDKSWQSYIANAESTYQKLTKDVEQRLAELAQGALAVRDSPGKYEKDPWLRQLDWGGQEVKMVKGKKKGDPPRPSTSQKLPGMPKWYKDLFASKTAKISLTVRTRIAPLLLRLSWDGYPLAWSDVFGWTFKVPKADISKFSEKFLVACDMSDEKNLELKEDALHQYFKLPHKDGPQARCATPLAKGYLQFFEGGTLSSEYAYAKEALEMNASCSYWISARARIMSQMAVYENEAIGYKSQSSSQNSGQGFILPQVIPMGTITRRAVENTWLTASNAKKNRVGSELKSMIKAPPGYHFVGADVDSEELWIASLVGDAQFRLHGGNAIGFMTLEGTKAAGTDLHSKTAKILGISRNDAKIFNYGRIYGAGLKFASTLLRQFNPTLSESETAKIAARLYNETKGLRTSRRVLSPRTFWRGGTESFVFNTLETFADQERPRTPVLGAGITEALMRKFITQGAFMTSRINWAIQSSGVDYLHLLIISMDYLISRFNLNARLAITVHDEIRYLVKSEDRYKVAMALQVANLWTRAMFSQQVGIDDLPQSCAFFSAVDIDHVLRKEVDMDCITPSNPTKIPHGETIDIWALIAKGPEATLDSDIVPSNPLHPDEYDYEPRRPIMADMLKDSASPEDIALIRAQITSSDEELREIVHNAKLSAANNVATPNRRPTKNRETVIERENKTTVALPQEPMLLEYSGSELNDFLKGFDKDGWKSKSFGLSNKNGMKKAKPTLSKV